MFPGWYAIVMGLAGLSLAWNRAVPLMGEMAGAASLVLAVAAAAVLIVLLAASVLRWQRHPEAWAEDRRHPVRHAFIATLPVAAMLVGTAGVALGGPSWPARVLWWAGSLAQLGVTLWVLSRWWRGGATPAAGGLTWAGATPALFIPIVGNVLAPLGGVPLGHLEWSAAQFGIGLLFWPVVTVLLLARLIVQGPWPERLRPSIFIFIAPPAVVGLSALQLGAPPLVGWMCWGMAMFSAAWVATQARSVTAMAFGLSHWAMSFPLAALAALTLRLGTGGGLLATLGPALLALASLVVAWLLLGTWRGLREGSLLAPEPVATIAAPEASARAA